jgi:hypothetical protein
MKASLKRALAPEKVCLGRTNERPVAKAPLIETDFQGSEDLETFLEN